MTEETKQESQRVLEQMYNSLTISPMELLQLEDIIGVGYHGYPFDDFPEEWDEVEE
jgi:hypothetical protein